MTDGPVPGWPGAPPGPATPPDSNASPNASPSVAATAPPTEAALREPAYRVSPKAKPMWMLSAALADLFPLAALLMWVALDQGRRSVQWPVLAVVLLLSALHVGVSPFWRYRVHRWEVTGEAVYTQTGWFSQERRIAPISRVQTVDARFGPMERMFGLGTLVVTTASAAGPLHIAGLERGTVERLVADLTRITGGRHDDAT